MPQSHEEQGEPSGPSFNFLILNLVTDTSISVTLMIKAATAPLPAL